MKKTIVSILIAVVLVILVPAVQAQDKEAGGSATFMNASGDAMAQAKVDTFRKREAIRQMLKRRNSPLLPHIDDFMKACEKYELDCYLLPSITGLESSFGHAIASGTYNPFGWGGGYIYFKDWGDGIDTVGRGLRENYINRGATSIESIGAMYAASPTWAARVRYFMGEFEQEESQIPSLLVGNSIQL